MVRGSQSESHFILIFADKASCALCNAGAMIGSFMFLYSILTLYGSSLLYREVKDDGCDPSGGLSINETCKSSGPDVFGAMLGVGKYIYD
jgi:hypothetical protein